MKNLIILLLLSFIGTIAYSQETTECLLEEAVIDGKPALVIDLTDSTEIAEYNAIFKKNGYKYKGYMWDNGLWEVVKQKNINLLRKMEKIDEEEGRLVVIFYDYYSQEIFYKMMCPILNDPAELDSILSNRKRY